MVLWSGGAIAPFCPTNGRPRARTPEAQRTHSAFPSRPATDTANRPSRTGEWAEVPVRELVPGDVVELAAGIIIPSDGTLVGKGEPMLIDESSLTGESLAVTKYPGDEVLSGAVVMQVRREWNRNPSPLSRLVPLCTNSLCVRASSIWRSPAPGPRLSSARPSLCSPTSRPRYLAFRGRPGRPSPPPLKR